MMLTAIIGGANTVWDDLERLSRLYGEKPEIIIAINDAGAQYSGDVDYWVSLHPEKMSAWANKRATQQLPPVDSFWFHRHMREGENQSINLKRHDVTSDWGGSSGLFAVKVALELDFEKIVLCGVPMSGEYGHFFDSKHWLADTKYRGAWLEHLDSFKDKVRSMSGWTSTLLSEPDRIWLEQ